MEGHPSPVGRQVLKILEEHARVPVQLEMRLDQLFENNRAGFASAMVKIEMGIIGRLCDDHHIEWLRTRTVEFLLWAIDRNADCGDGEFELPCYPFSAQDDDDAVERRSEQYFANTLVADMANDRLDTAGKFHALESMRRFPHLFDAYVYLRRKFREFLQRKKAEPEN